MIELQAVTKLYGTVIGVNEISLKLQPGAYGLLGPNGSGKTTLLNLIMGQLKPTLGTIRVFGEEPRNNFQLFKRIGFCPGAEGMYSSVSGLEWVSYLMELHGFDPPEATKRAKQQLIRVGMQDAMTRPIGSYSRGMRQRVKLAQALAHEPELLILDEPLSGLDPIARFEVTKLLRDWIDRGRSVIVASHVLHEIEAITDSFMLICGGRLLASGSARDVEEVLSGIPSEIQIRSDKPRLLASVLIREEMVDRINFDESTAMLRLTTAKPSAFFERLPNLAAEFEVQIDELSADNDSLDSLFRSMMKVHRGEA